MSVFSIKRKCFHHCFLKSNLLIYLAVYIQFVPVYIHTHFKDGYQHHQFLPILNTHHQASSPIIRYHHSHYFFTIKTQKDNHDKFVLFAVGFSMISSAAKINLLVNNHFHTIMLPPITLSCKMHLHHQNT